VLAYTYPVLDAFVTILWFFLWVIWLVLVFRIILDIFRSHDISGWSKALWLILILILPFLGVVIYLIARGGKMHERDVNAARAQDEAFRSYVRDAAAPSQADELAKLASLKDSGALSEEEFQQQKAKILSQ
jgi:ABC-type multidrug transport system fused ATPase/permease subunit